MTMKEIQWRLSAMGNRNNPKKNNKSQINLQEGEKKILENAILEKMRTKLRS